MSDLHNRMPPGLFFEIPHAETPHRTFVLRKLLERYQMGGENKYVLLYHYGQYMHFVIGMYSSEREALIARHAANMMVISREATEGFTQVHQFNGPPLANRIYDPAEDEVTDYDGPVVELGE